MPEPHPNPLLQGEGIPSPAVRERARVRVLLVSNHEPRKLPAGVRPAITPPRPQSAANCNEGRSEFRRLGTVLFVRACLYSNIRSQIRDPKNNHAQGARCRLRRRPRRCRQGGCVPSHSDPIGGRGRERTRGKTPPALGHARSGEPVSFPHSSTRDFLTVRDSPLAVVCETLHMPGLRRR